MRNGVPVVLAIRRLHVDMDVRVSAARGRREVEGLGGVVDGSDGRRRGRGQLAGSSNGQMGGTRNVAHLVNSLSKHDSVWLLVQ